MYTVLVYDTSDEPAGDPPRFHARYNTAQAALAEAQRIVDSSLRDELPSATSAEDLKERFALFGEGALIHGEPHVDWHVYEYADQRAAEIFATKVPK